jgi:subtilisin family serine protease
LGISGINWNSKLLLVSGVSNIGEVIKALEYIYLLKKTYLDSNGTTGANVVVNNFSGGLRRLFPEDFPSWCEMYDLLGEVGILSVGAVANENFNVETEGDLPTLCSSDYLLMVTNTNSSNEKVLDAAYGKISVDLGAPGENITSTSIGNDYENISGTSASAPHVTGVVGLLHSLPCTSLADLSFSSPQDAALLVKNAVLNGTQISQSLTNTVSGGRLNAFQAMVQLQDLCGSQRSNELSLNIFPNIISGEENEVKLNYQTTNTDLHSIRLFDSQGRLILKEDFIPPLFENRSIRIDLSGTPLSKGVFFMQLSNSSEQVSQHLVKF